MRGPRYVLGHRSLCNANGCPRSAPTYNNDVFFGSSKTSDYPSNPRADIAVRLADVVVRGGVVKSETAVPRPSAANRAKDLHGGGPSLTCGAHLHESFLRFLSQLALYVQGSHIGLTFSEDCRPIMFYQAVL